MADLRGTDGDDAIVGTVGDDSIVSGFGNDTVDGGSGNDAITDEGGRINTLLGGDGNDLIVFAGKLFANSEHDDVVTSTTIDAGLGDDIVRFDSFYGGTASISLGVGNDVLVLGATQMVGSLFEGTHIELGSGMDRIVLGDGLGRRLDGESFGLFQQDWGARGALVIADFTAGAGGDSLDLGAFLVGFYNRPNSGTWTPFQNPFASGHVYLIQDGADTLVRIDVTGAPHNDPNYEFDFIRLVGVSASDLVAHNFAGYDPGGAPLPYSATLGTEGNDRLLGDPGGSELFGLAGNDDLGGSIGDDVLHGDDGDDRLAGGHGWDYLIGGIGNDTLDGGVGSDLIDGGDGNDTIVDSGGSDLLLGGAGDDTITLNRPNEDPYHLVAIYESIEIEGEDGNDTVSVTFGRNTDPADVTELAVSLGAGNDVFSLDAIRVTTALSLGSGTDRVFVSGQAMDLFNDLKLLTTGDFAAGDGGDVLDLTGIIGWHSLNNPFASGHLRLAQSGADTIVSWDYDGTGGGSDLFQLVKLVNVPMASLTAFNFNGFAPGGGGAVATATNGTAIGDTLYGDAGNNTVNGLDGNDFISGGWGNDTIDGGGGDDVLEGGYGVDTIHGGEGNDIIEDTGLGNDTWLYGDGGDDTIRVFHRYIYANETVTVSAGDGNDVVDVSIGLSSGFNGTVVADLGTGNDDYYVRFTPGPLAPHGGTTLTLGAGVDRVHFEVDLVAAGIPFTPNPVVRITDFQAGDGGDIVDLAAYVLAFNRPSPIPGYRYEGWEYYNPFATGGARLVQSGSDVALLLERIAGDSNPGTLIVFENTTLADFTAYNFGIDIVLDTATTTAGDDALAGTAARDVYRGGAGNDQLSGLGGDDVLVGGNGDDILNGGNGFNVLSGGVGVDTVIGGADVDVIYGSGFDTIDAGAGNDQIYTGGQDYVTAGDGNDHIIGLGNFNVGRNPAFMIYAGNGDDSITLGSGTFLVDAGAGNDELRLSNTEYFELTLGLGVDTVYYGPVGAFVYNPSQIVITDFQAGDGGDIFVLSSAPHPTSKPFDNPFYSGILTLKQVGPDVILTTTYTIYENRTLATFKNANVTDFTAHNFNGLTLQRGISQPILVSDTDVTIAPGTDQTLLNPIAADDQDFAALFLYDLNQTGVDLINHGHMSASIAPGAPVGWLAGFQVGFYSTAFPGGQMVNAADGVVEVNSQGHDAYGFYAPSTQTIPFINDGLLTVTSAGEYAVGVLTGWGFGPYTSLTNGGTISVQSGDTAIGVELGPRGVFTNTGLIEAEAEVFAVGVHVRVETVAMSIVNAGTIVAVTDPASPYASVGLLIKGSDYGSFGNTLTNSGTIEAEIALAYDFYNYVASETLINSGTIDGWVMMGPLGDLVVNSGEMSGRTLLDDGNDTYDGAGGFHYGTVEGEGGHDIITGGGGTEFIFGDGGEDRLIGGGGDDVIEGGVDNDRLSGGTGADELVGGDGADVFVYSAVLDSVAGEADWLSDFAHGIDKIQLRKIAVTGISFEVAADNSSTTVTVATKAGASMVLRVAGVATMADFLTPETTFAAPSQWLQEGAGAGQRWHLGDFDGDGRDDVFRYVPGTSGADMFLSDGSSFDHVGSWTDAWNGDAGWHIGDFNGDGKDDVFRYLPGTSGADMFLSNGSGFVHDGSWTGAGNGSAGWHVGDFNGDGRDDVFRYLPGTSGADMWLSTGSGFAHAGSWTGAGNGSAGWHVGDFNGDGKDDVFRYLPGQSGADMWLSTGSSFAHAGSWTGAGSGADGWRIGDFNGDGKDDMLRYLPGTSGADMWLSTGSGLARAGSWTGAGYGDFGWHIGDFNGDGSADLLRILANGSEVLL